MEYGLIKIFGEAFLKEFATIWLLLVIQTFMLTVIAMTNFYIFMILLSDKVAEEKKKKKEEKKKLEKVGDQYWHSEKS
jgi:hypothetical protein